MEGTEMALPTPEPRKQRVLRNVNKDWANCECLYADVITAWIEDLTDPDFGVKFNADVACAVVKKGRKSITMGDAALFLVLRQVGMEDGFDITTWYEGLAPAVPRGTQAPEYLVSKYSGIPFVDARKLMWPQPLFDADYELSNMKARQFVAVLKHYLMTGEVSWEKVLNPPRKVKKDTTESSLQ